MEAAKEEKVGGGGWMEGRTKYILQYALDPSWYLEALKEHTPRTTFVAPSRLQLEALYELCQLYQRHRPLEMFSAHEEGGGGSHDASPGEFLVDITARLSPEHRAQMEEVKLLSEIPHGVVVVVAEVGRAIAGFGGEAFVKLSTRSPKDAVTGSLNGRMVSHLIREMEHSDGTPNGDSVAFVTASRRAFRVTSAEEAIDLLARSSRVMEDLMKTLDVPDLSLPLDLIVREWFDMRPEMEFRVFVKNRQITAISQYCYYQYFPQLAEAKEGIQRRIFELWSRIAHLAPQARGASSACASPDLHATDNCVVDFVMMDDRPVIIEFNPFFGDTGACLFSWREPDRRILHGEAPFEFRVLEEAKEDPLECFATDWVQFINQRRGRPYLPLWPGATTTDQRSGKQQHQRGCLLS